jgi:hypothetical protein
MLLFETSEAAQSAIRAGKKERCEGKPVVVGYRSDMLVVAGVLTDENNTSVYRRSWPGLELGAVNAATAASRFQRTTTG